MVEVDARGLSCPQPIVRTKKAIEENPGTPLKILVDEAVAKENVMRFAESQGFTVDVDSEGDEYHLTLKPASA